MATPDFLQILLRSPKKKKKRKRSHSGSEGHLEVLIRQVADNWSQELAPQGILTNPSLQASWGSLPKPKRKFGRAQAIFMNQEPGTRNEDTDYVFLFSPSSRRKVNTDPNNTKWSRDTNTFGQKILRQQGWQPGQFLGAEDAPHAELFTAANASYIRVALKDDVKGLGFDKAKQDEGAGLDAFSDLLSRLNGKSAAEVQEVQAARMVVKTNRWVEMKYGAMRFVRGGLLVGDEMEEEEEEDGEDKMDTSGTDTKALTTKSTSTDLDAGKKKEKTSKKRKAASVEDSESSSEEESDGDEKPRRRRKESKRKKSRPDEEDTARDDDAKARRKEERRAKKAKKDRSTTTSTSAEEGESDVDRASRRKSKSKSKETGAESSPSDPEDESERKRLKKERKERKERKREEKQKKKEDKRLRKEEKKRRKLLGSGESSSSSSTATPGDTTPAGESGASTPVYRPNPHLVRSRYIASKRKAMMDDKALEQILMLKV